MSIHYSDEQYKDIVSIACTFLDYVQSKGIEINHRTKYLTARHERFALSYCPSNKTFHYYDIERNLLFMFARIDRLEDSKKDAQRLWIGTELFEWYFTRNSYKEGISTVILAYDPAVENKFLDTTWDLSELRQLMLKTNFKYPLLYFSYHNKNL